MRRPSRPVRWSRRTARGWASTRDLPATRSARGACSAAASSLSLPPCAVRAVGHSPVGTSRPNVLSGTQSLTPGTGLSAPPVHTSAGAAMPTHRRTWLGLAAATILAACSESTSPTLPDSQGLNSDLQTVSGVFQTDVFKSFGAIGTAPGSPAATTTPPGALLRATSPLAPSSANQPYAATPQRLQALRVAASGMTAATTGVIPPAVWGKTYVWDVATHQYVVGPDPGPANGVRIILYQVDAFGQVIEPTVEVGHVDLLDESDVNTSKLHVIVQDASSSPVTYADYTISATVVGSPVSEFTGTTSGYVSDGTHTV